MMTDIDRTRVDRALEEICQSGCARVREIIDEIGQGDPPASATKLNPAEQALLLEELSAIMSAYQRTCPTR